MNIKVFIANMVILYTKMEIVMKVNFKTVKETAKVNIGLKVVQNI
jgi:hypothetical protein